MAFLCPEQAMDTTDDTTELLTMTALLRHATDEHGSGPASGAIRAYIASGLIRPTRDSTGRLLFRPSDARRVLQIYQARKVRHGVTGRRDGSTTQGLK